MWERSRAARTLSRESAVSRFLAVISPRGFAFARVGYSTRITFYYEQSSVTSVCVSECGPQLRCVGGKNA